MRHINSRSWSQLCQLILHKIPAQTHQLPIMHHFPPWFLLYRQVWAFGSHLFPNLSSLGMLSQENLGDGLWCWHPVIPVTLRALATAWGRSAAVTSAVQCLLVTAKEMSLMFHPNFYEPTEAHFRSAQAVQPTSIILAFTYFCGFFSAIKLEINYLCRCVHIYVCLCTLHRHSYINM